MTRIFLAASILLIFAGTSPAADWPMYRADAARSGYTAEPIAPEPALRWRIRERHAPCAAWPSSVRMTCDRAYGMAVAGGTLYYATSSDNKVVAADAATGKTRWTCVTDAPVRFAPAVWQDKVFVAGDDGFLYCLAAADGQVCWKLRGGPGPDMVLGNDRMVSRWPARGGPVVADGIVYFGAGIWPSEGIFLYAIDAATGKRRWLNDSSGALEMNQPHPGARAKSGVAAQGPLAIAGDALLVPTGRAVPAAFALADGELRYFHLQVNRGTGGSDIVVVDGRFFNGGVMFAAADGRTELILAPKKKPAPAKTAAPPAPVKKPVTPTPEELASRVAAHPRWVVYSDKNRVIAVDRTKPLVEKDSIDSKGKKIRTKKFVDPAWTTSIPVGEITSLIVAGDRVVAGAKDRVFLLDAASGRIQWQAVVEGAAYDLAVAGGQLYVSTDRGLIYAFGGGKAAAAEIRASSAPPQVKPDAPCAAAAAEILRDCPISQGYCLDLACGDGRLALEIARRTKFRIYAVEADAEKAQAARQLFEAAGLYGVRVTVHHADPARIAYPNYFADLVVSGRSVTEGAQVVPKAPMARVLRPYGGIARIGRPGAMETSTRGPLEGAAEWTHLYADAGNTLCSGDARPRSPLHMLWYRDTDLVMPSRHGRGPAPLVAQGRMFVEGLSGLRAVNVYNGSTLWEIPLPKILVAYHQDHLTGVAATGSNLCLGEDRLFFHDSRECRALDVATGRELARWSPPPRPDGKPATWGYLAYCQGILFGSVANPEHLVKESWRSHLGKLDMSHLWSESLQLFALDARTGERKWTFTPKHSLRNNAIAVGGGRVYLIDRPLALVDTPQLPAKAKGLSQNPGRRTSEPVAPDRSGIGSKPSHPPGRLVCLDAQTGKVLWGVEEGIYGTLLALSTAHDVLLMTYQPTRFKLDSELGGRMAAFRASDGTRLWDIEAKYLSRPILNDTMIYAELGQWELRTGDSVPFVLKRSHGCGILSGSKRLLVYRSATLAYCDLETKRENENYGGIRPGCWVNAIPAGGLVLLADAASWCTCSYLNQATVALEPAGPIGPAGSVTGRKP